jgi:hypothetical protein
MKPLRWALALWYLTASPAAAAEERAAAPAATPAATPGAEDKGFFHDGTSHLFWVFPNYQMVEEEKPIVPLTTGEKFKIATQDSFDPLAFPVAGFYAGIAHVRNQYEEWGRGPEGYGKRYGAAFADQTISNFMVEGAFPSLLHEDPRYFRLGRGGFWHRTGYALSRVFVVRKDRGGSEFNYSEFAGNGVMAAAGNAYYPSGDRTLAATGSRLGLQIGMDLVFNVGKEFWPDIRRALTGS